MFMHSVTLRTTLKKNFSDKATVYIADPGNTIPSSESNMFYGIPRNLCRIANHAGENRFRQPHS